MKHIVFFALSILLFPICSPAQSPIRHPLTFDDLIAWGRVADPEISPDGKEVAYTVTFYDKISNTNNNDIYVASIDGKEIRKLTDSPRADHTPRWSPDGKSIAFVSNRNGSYQIYLVPAAGGEARRITDVSTGVSGLLWSPDGSSIAYVSEVYPDLPDDAANRKRIEDLSAGTVKAKIFTRLPYRLWDGWIDGKRSHLLLAPVSGGPSRDMTPGEYDTPPIDVKGDVDYAFSPDGGELAFVRNTDSTVASSTNNDIFTVPVNGGNARRITSNPACDNQPLYSPDGRYIAYKAMARPGYEADRYVLTLYERVTGKTIPLTESLDRSVDEVVWARDSKHLYFTADDMAYHNLFRVDVATAAVEQLTEKMSIDNIRLTPDGRTLVFIRQSIRTPGEIWCSDADGKNLSQLSHVNDERLSRLEMNPLEEFWFTGAEGTRIQGLIVKPPGFESSKRYPMIYLIHGGPQGAWGDNITYRWNAQMFAAPGYVVVMVNPRGSTGYGQKFCDEIGGDWGGKVYDDLMAGVKYCIDRYSFIDGERIAAAGASYGGYMINWIEGHNPGYFKVLVSHDGDSNLRSAYGTTEELWFPEWEFRGTPWSNPEMYERWSPLKPEAVKNFSTPILLIHGQLDFRVDVSEGFQMFTAVQKMHVPSKLIYFPDEGHWVLKPQNSEFWYQQVLGWIKAYIN